MNQDQVMSITRAALQILGTVIVTYGASAGITNEVWSSIAGTVIVLVPVVWGIVAHTQAHAVGSVAAMSSTSVSKDGRTITLHDSGLAQSAKDNATPLSSGGTVK